MQRCYHSMEALINELKQGRELAKQLKNHINPSSSSQACHLLVQKIISSYEKTLNKLPLSPPSSNRCKSCARTHGSNLQDSKTHPDASKKWKPLPKWTEQVRSESDRHGWRKYGQKAILGAIHPREYYRCMHRHVQGCLATKQVQRSDQDPTVFNITYRGQHTCTESVRSPNPSPETKIIKPARGPIQAKQQKRRKFSHTHDQFQFSFRVRNEELSLEEKMIPTFSSFPSTSGNKSDDCALVSAEGDQFMSIAPLNISPATSESDFYAECHVGLSQLNVQRSESSDLPEAGSCLISVSNSPMGASVSDLDLDFPVGSIGMDFESTFLLDFLDFEQATSHDLLYIN